MSTLARCCMFPTCFVWYKSKTWIALFARAILCDYIWCSFVSQHTHNVNKTDYPMCFFSYVKQKYLRLSHAMNRCIRHQPFECSLCVVLDRTTNNVVRLGALLLWCHHTAHSNAIRKQQVFDDHSQWADHHSKTREIHTNIFHWINIEKEKYNLCQAICRTEYHRHHTMA